MEHAAEPPAPRTLLDRIADAAIAVAAAALGGLVVVQGWQVVARYVLNASPSWTEPVTLLLLSTAMSLGAAAGVHTRRHFSFNLMAEAMRPGARRLAEAVSVLVIVAIGATLAGWSAVLLVDGFGVRAAGAPLPQSINYLPLGLGGALMAVFALARVPALLAPVEAGEGV
ncbi:TRAP transporter small permease subunit [Luteimonas aestuarii]|uniref:TRAP transporter small permease protein n=2 Tax=Luteimonas aestuarii TaxID=453837 RepID=A0A4R5U0R3_9GAMM|nr:TRAP transporter small permease subunit [Luteimonas aestuarii]TDK27178.1 TRAP transporter small permease subunit [Luteimonas aestuarii]